MRNNFILNFRSIKYAALVFFGMMFFATSLYAGNVGNLNRRANRHFDRGEYAEALKLYEDALAIAPTDGKLLMNRASTLYRLGEYGEAERSLFNALANLSESDRNALADAHYNLGNTQFRLGEEAMATGESKDARDRFNRAIESYVNTLKLRPDDNDAKWNLQLAHERMNEAENESQDDGDNENEDGDDENENGGGNQDQSDDNNDDGDDGGGQDNNQDNNQNDNQDNNGQNERDAESDMRREEAQRLIEQFADDDEDLNRPPQRRMGVRQPEKMW